MTNSNVDTGQQDMVIEGYAIIFNSLSDDLGGFREIVAPNALDGVNVSDVKCLINHDFSYIIGAHRRERLSYRWMKKGYTLNVTYLIHHTQEIFMRILKRVT